LADYLNSFRHGTFRPHNVNDGKTARPPAVRMIAITCYAELNCVIRRWLQQRCDCDSTALQPFNDLRYDRIGQSWVTDKTNSN